MARRPALATSSLRPTPTLPTPPNPSTLMRLVEFNYDQISLNQARMNAAVERKRLQALLQDNPAPAGVPGVWTPLTMRRHLIQMAILILDMADDVFGLELKGQEVPHWKNFQTLDMILRYTAEMSQMGLLVGV